MPVKDIVQRRIKSLFMGGAVGLACGAVVIAAQSAAPETFAALVSRLQQEKPTFAKRQQVRHLLAARYDLADRAAPGVMMSRGKAVQDGVRVKLPANVTWESLASMTPETIKAQNLWPAGFLPLPHPHHEAGGMIFPKFLIDETKRQTDRDLTRASPRHDVDRLLRLPPRSSSCRCGVIDVQLDAVRAGLLEQPGVGGPASRRHAVERTPHRDTGRRA